MLSRLKPTKFKPGQRVRIMDTAGTLSGKLGTIIPRSQVKTDGRGIPQLPGHYKPVDWDKEVAIRCDDGNVVTMFKVCVVPL